MAKCYIVQRKWQDSNGDRDETVPNIYLNQDKAKDEFQQTIGKIVLDWEGELCNIEVTLNSNCFDLYDKNSCEYDRVEIIERELIE